MKRFSYMLFIIAFTLTFSGCAKGSAEEAAATTPQPEKPAAVEAPKAAPHKMVAAPAPAPAPPKARIPATVQVPEGTELSVLLIDSISTGKNKDGDPFMASLAEPIVVDGRTIVDQGTKVQGRVV